MADRDLILGTRGEFLPQPADDLTLTLGMLPGGAAFPAAFTATVRFGAALIARPPLLAGFTATVRFGAALTAAFDLGLPHYLADETGTVWQHGERLRDEHATTWQHGDPCRTAPQRLPWRHGAPRRTAPRRIPWRHGDRVRTNPQRIPWHHGDRVRTDPTHIPWRDGTSVRTAPTRIPWRDGEDARLWVRMPWRDGEDARLWVRLPWQRAAESRHDRRLPWQPGLHSHRPHRLPWQDGLLIETDGGNPWPPPPDVPPFVPPVDLRFCRVFVPQPADWLELILGLPPCGGEGPPALVIIPVRKVYLVLNDTHLYKLDGMIDLPTLGMQLSLDVDSWTWGFSATLPADQLPRVVPDVDGTPVLLAAVINGESFYLLAESIQRERSFGAATIRIAGRGKNAMLDAPYALTQSFGNAGADRTAAQLLDDALKLNGVSIGWSVDFDLDDWLVDAGAWSVQGSHMAGALSVAGAAGGYIQPHPTDDVLRVLPRYPTAPWDWAGVSPDYELPSAVTVQEGIAWVEKPRYNRVFVSGQSKGVLGQVTRSGTAGDLVAPMITDPLITRAAAARQRGINVLADTGRIATVSLRLPVLVETGIITPGKFVRYNDMGVYRLGIVRSTAVDVRFPEVWQTIGVETHE